MLLYKAREGAFVEGKVDFSHKMIAQYHAELHDADKSRVLEEFTKPDSIIRCLVSTVAFGLGIDIPDIRLIVHWGESDTVAQFWQEVGRGGRDGQPTESHLYHRELQLRQCQPEVKEFVSEVQLKR